MLDRINRGMGVYEIKMIFHDYAMLIQNFFITLCSHLIFLYTNNVHNIISMMNILGRVICNDFALSLEYIICKSMRN